VTTQDGHDPFVDGFDPELQKMLREAYAHVLSDLSTNTLDGQRKAVETAVAEALVSLAKAGQRNPDQLRHYATYKGRQALP
jgi:hypothetical protein